MADLEVELKPMNTPTLPDHTATNEQFTYSFGSGVAEGNGSMKGLLGGKGAALAEMTRAGLPVPPGYTIQTEACRYYLKHGKNHPAIDEQTEQAMTRLEIVHGRRFGDHDCPLLVSVRSGAKFSMPGMMDTVLNVGLNDDTVLGLAKETNNPQFAWDCYRRLLQMFGSTVLGVPKRQFEHIIEAHLLKAGQRSVVDLPVDELKRLVLDFEHLIFDETGKEFPQDPHTQLKWARDAVFRSWNGERAKHYRRMNAIPDDLGTAVNVQAMVYGNLGDDSGTGVGFTRNPATGAKEFFGEFLQNAQGEDVVSGVRTPLPITKLKELMPSVYDQLVESTSRLERHYRDVQDFEFTIERAKLYILQTRNGKRTGHAAVKIAVDMVHEGLITEKEALYRVEPNQLFEFMVPVISGTIPNERVIAKGLPASPGGAVGRITFTADWAREIASRGGADPIILVRAETTPEDIHGMEVSAGILTSRGGMTSHAAVVARGMGKCCIVGATEIEVDELRRQLRIGHRTFREGDWLSLDGSTGRVIEGKADLERPNPDVPLLVEFMGYADKYRRMKIRANADTPIDATTARRFGAQGIGLCRTEHMFFAPDRIAAMRRMIMATSEAERRRALAELLPMQKQDFVGIFRAMEGLPVTIRLLDPPLHEFLPPRDGILAELRTLQRKKGHEQRIAELRAVLKRVEELHELNPMLGHRGCRLGITYPEITEMQAQAIFEAAEQVAGEGKKVFPEVMVPLIGTVAEFHDQRQVIDRVAEQVFAKSKRKLDYHVGCMIEVPRAALCADEIGAESEFFSFGTNDLTQMTYGFSRDDIAKFLPTYLSKGILKQDPFVTIDQIGVGQLVQMAVERGRGSNAKLKVGICGEHGGDPASIRFFDQVDLDYVSCSPYRVLTARLAAAQASTDRENESSRQTI
jgi:pyruvate,orthophosphate dikinase